jgi:segregation and condensation protein A
MTETLGTEVPTQQEMPFAIVDGEPISEPPRDLYIPPQALQIFLEAFEGPLDLLLYLIRRQNLDILNIPISEITRQYLEYIDLMQDLELELAGEYLLMAAMLAEIKSRMLLPRPPSEAGDTEEDPRAELVRRLQQYERFKQAAEDIDALKRLERDVFVAEAELVERRIVKVLPEVTLKEMLLAFKEVIGRAAMFAHHQVQRERLSVRQRMSDILERLQADEFVDFLALFNVREGRMGVTVTFVAILELVREGLIDFVQTEIFAPLHVRRSGVSEPMQRARAADEGLATAAATVTDEAALAAAGAETGERDGDEHTRPHADDTASHLTRKRKTE